MPEKVPADPAGSRGGGRRCKGRVLIVDDDRSLNEALVGLLAHAGYDAAAVATGAEALAVLRRQPTELVLLDLRLGTEDGLELLGEVKKIRPEISAIVITALGTIETAVEAMQRGADNFVVKPLDPPRLLAVVAKGLESRALRARATQLERIESGPASRIIAESDAMQEAVRLAEAAAPHETTILITGETGTGKGLLARQIHERSSRRPQPFVELNCAGLQRDLTESELFGHEKGAFTGASERKLGLFEAAAGGTLFLDEIGEMDAGIQAKLLKAIEEKTFRRIGGLTEIEVDVRLVAATHRNLEREVAEGRFRQDLFYRLSVFAVRLPPLRERRDDIIPLAFHFLKQYRRGVAAPNISDEVQDVLESYDWPGNVRELRNVVERACILSPAEEELRPEHLPALAASAHAPADGERPGRGQTMRELERDQIEQALSSQGGNVKAAAQQLGISRGTLYRKAKRYNITLP